MVLCERVPNSSQVGYGNNEPDMWDIVLVGCNSVNNQIMSDWGA